MSVRLLKSACSTALFAAVGLLVGGVAMPSAKAADLGGDCCADLEERVAELEATTARKGNRRMSLTVSGQVNRSILYWSGGAPPVGADSSGVYAGLDNHNQSTRFIFSGTAKVSPNLVAGFEFLTEWAGGARTSLVAQDSVDGSVSGQSNLTGSGDGILAVRTANWWLEDKTLGRVTVGRINAGGPVPTIDLGGIGTVAGHSPSLVGGGFFVAGGAKLSSIIGPTYGSDRIEGIRYDTPTIGGFVAQASWGEDDVWTASLRYAGEFAGVRVAAGIGIMNQDPILGNNPSGLDTSNTFTRGETEWAGSLALMHIASGLFAQGHYAKSEFFNGEEGTLWLVQGGITKNWFGLGNTSLYGEYGNAEDYAKAGTSIAGLPAATSSVDFYGVGVVQQIDAAAMEIYLGWRRFETDVTGVAGGSGTSDLDLVQGGARIRF